MYLALDVGGTSVGIGIYNDLDPQSLLHKHSILVQNDFEKDINQITLYLEGVKATEFDYVGIGIPGSLNEETRTTKWLSNLSSWENKNLKEEFSKYIKFNDLFLAHDVKAAAASEAIFGEEKTDFTFVIWGTGIGGSSVRFRGGKPTFQQIELGYQTISEKITLEGEEFPGYLEYFCGGGRLKQRFGKPAADLNEEEWTDVFEKMAQGLHNLLVMNFSPRIIFSGGVITKQQHRLQALKELINEKSRFTTYTLDELKIGKFGEDAGLVGALALIKLNLH